MIPIIELDADGSATARFPYTPFVIEQIKTRIPAHDRRWDKETKRWWVAAVYVQRVTRILEGYFGTVEVVQPPAPTSPAPRGLGGHYATLHLLPSAPPELVDAAYRALARLTHPDGKPAAEIAGATAAMQRLNGSYQAIKGQRS